MQRIMTYEYFKDEINNSDYLDEKGKKDMLDLYKKGITRWLPKSIHQTVH